VHLKNILGGDMIHLEIPTGGELLMNVLKRSDWITAIRLHDGQLSLTMERGDKRIPELMNIARQTGIDVQSVNLRKPSLEDVFLHFTGHSIREKEEAHEPRARFTGHPGPGKT
jgi:ABC-2 type transport system ATP-binding protein